VTECSHAYFTGGFPRDGSDGIYGIVKKDELTQVQKFLSFFNF
jgi:hypothetical protein